MAPKNIKKVLDLAIRAREKGLILNPLFTGQAGLGKSFVVQQWAEDQKKLDSDFKFIDLRIAYLEAPDLIGFPEIIEDKQGRRRTQTNLPAFWPTEGRGILFLEEPNRGTQSIMNCLMQLLTDRKLHDYTLPEGWIIAAAINPEDGDHDVNSMDAALLNRFEEYEITYNHKDFIDYVKSKNWHGNVTSFLNGNFWNYAVASEISVDSKYISPRTWEKLNNAELSGLKDDRELHSLTSDGILGRQYGKAYHQFVYEQSPVLAKDLLVDEKKSLIKLLKQADKETYRGDLVNVTVVSITDEFPNFPLDKLVKVCQIIPADQAVALLESYVTSQSKDDEVQLKSIMKKYPEIKDVIKQGLARSKQKDIIEEKVK